MVLDMKRAVIELEHREVIPVKDAVGTRIHCLRGRIWITELRCTEDIVLEASESYEIERVGVAVVQALRDAVVVLCAPTVPRAGLAAAVLTSRTFAATAPRRLFTSCSGRCPADVARAAGSFAPALRDSD